MTESPIHILEYEGSLTSLRRSSSVSSQLNKSTGAAKRGIELQPKWKNGGLDLKHQCPLCNNFLRYPMKFRQCGHHVCSSCLSDALRVVLRCPVCQRPISKEKAVHDEDLEKRIQNLEVSCTYQDQGCPWQGILRNFQVHIEQCDFVSIECSNECGIKFERRFLVRHQSEDCIKRQITCEFCRASIRFDERTTHVNVCPEFKIPCPHQCSTTEYPRGKMQSHLQSECPKHEISCPFHDCGCEFHALRSDMLSHMQQMPGFHLNMVGKVLSLQQHLLKSYEERFAEQTKCIEHLTQKVNALMKQTRGQCLWKIDNYHERFQEARANKKSTLFSPPFYSSPHGYRLGLSICLWGDGKAKGKYVSLFICIYRGDYDLLLAWPFSRHITFTLFDQNEDLNNRHNVTCAIRPNACSENAVFLGRPTSERNASFGCPKFIPIDSMMKHNYIKNDAIFIKVEVDNESAIIENRF